MQRPRVEVEERAIQFFIAFVRAHGSEDLTYHDGVLYGGDAEVDLRKIADALDRSTRTLRLVR